MTETEWLQDDDHRAMMHVLKETASPRKLRLFASACCRRVKWYDSGVIDLIEEYADGRAKRKDAMRAVKTAVSDGRINIYCKYLFWRSECHYGADIAAAFAINYAITSHELEESPDNELDEDRLHATLLRCVFGNPFNTITLNAGCRTRIVTQLAQAAYTERRGSRGELDYQRLAVLSDALEEVGVPAEMTVHLRSLGPHVRGCWAIDLILGLS